MTTVEHLKKLQEQGNIISLVDTILYHAIERQASDVHLESTDQGLRIRYRIDGVLYDQLTLDAHNMPQVLSRLKLVSSLNIAEKRVPQDGKFCITFGTRSIDLRISTFPGLYGEKIVVRILDRSLHTIDIDQLGFSIPMLKQFHTLITKPSGLFLVTGPTGSGKTTTLYAALSEISSKEQNTITLEDPVEYNVPGITQGQINPDAGFTFEKGIRAMLRQDPDVVMIGEIRDAQTAHIAIEAALTGHLVLSTLHTNDAPGTIMRLMDMGIEPFLINAALIGVLSQQLARKICVSCRYEAVPTVHERNLMDRLGIYRERLHKGRGCQVCFNLGYKGRVGIFELLVMSNHMRALISKQPVFDAINDQARADGMQTLVMDGAQKVQEGIISLQELARIVL